MMSAISTVYIILLAFITKTIYCSKTVEIKMINDYMNQDLLKSTIVSAYLCWETDEKCEFLNLLFKNNHSVSLTISSEDDANPGLTILHILDMQCNNSWDLLKQANKKKLFNAPFKWLLLSDGAEILQDRIEYFSTYDINPSSNIVISQKVENNKFVFTDIYRYSQFRKDIVMNQVANWTEETKFGDFKQRILTRERQDLNGTVITSRMVIIDNDSLNHMEDFRFGHIDSLSKVNYMFALHLMDFMNAILDLKHCESWGYGNKTGMIGYLEKGEAEIGGSSAFMTEDRLKAVDFVSKTTLTKLQFVFRQPPLSYESNLFTLPFTRSLWICSFCLIMLAVFLLYYAVSREWKDPDLEVTDASLKADFMEVVMLAIGALSQQGATHEPRSASGKMIMITIFIALMFLYVSYSANIVALLQTSATSINTLKDLLNSRLKIGAHNTVYNVYFFSSASDPIRKAIYEKKVAPLGKKPQFFTLEEGIRRVRKGFFALHVEVGPGYKVISDTFFEGEKCNLQEMSFLPMDDTYLPVRKHSPYKEILAIGYRKIMESGIQDRVNKRFYPKKPKCHGASASFVTVGLIDSYPAFLILGIGIGLSSVLLIIENIATKNCR